VAELPEAERLIDRRTQEVIAGHERLRTGGLIPRIVQAAGMIVDSYRSGGKVAAFGNGGSAADAAHIVGELVGRFGRDRPPLGAIALTDNAPSLTAISNDYAFEEAFARQVRAVGTAGDVAVAISTSGNSANVIAAVAAAREIGMKTIGLTGADGGRLAREVDLCLSYPAQITPQVQEGHAFIGHMICELVEDDLFPPTAPA